MTKDHFPQVVFQSQAHESMRQGIDQIGDAIRPTLGPLPRIVAVADLDRRKTPR